MPPEPTAPLAWCVVANVATETAHGPGDQEVRSGRIELVLWPSREEAEDAAARWAAVESELGGVGSPRLRGELIEALDRLATHPSSWGATRLIVPCGAAVTSLVGDGDGDGDGGSTDSGPPGRAGARPGGPGVVRRGVTS